MANITSLDGAVQLVHDGVTYEPVQGYVFEVPADLAEHLVLFPQWRVTEQEDLGGIDLSELGSAPERAPRVRRRTPRKAAAKAAPAAPAKATAKTAAKKR